MILLLSSQHFQNIFRVNVFARFLNILDDSINYNVDELKKYLEGVNYLTNISNAGTPI